MKPSNKITVTVFGNPIEPRDNLAVLLVPKLKARFPDLDFRIEDPTESIEPTGDPWIMLDVAEGIEKVTVVEDLKQLEPMRGSGAHDYDLYLELRLREKLGRLPKIKLILIPNRMSQDAALKTLEPILHKMSY
jgi:hypothetical protein